MWRSLRAASVTAVLAGLVGAGCPYPSFDVEGNQPVTIVGSTPPAFALQTLDRGCLSRDGIGPDTVDLFVEIDEPDGDTLFHYWYVNYEPDQQRTQADWGFPVFTIDACATPGLDRDGPNVIRLLVMDRPARVIDGEPPLLVEEGGSQDEITWTLALTPDTYCCGEAPQ